MGLLNEIWKNRKLIKEGVINKYFTPNEIADLIKDTVNERKQICSQCPLLSDNAKILFSYKTMRIDSHCTKCGCNIDLKTSSLHSSCPDNPPRWLAVITEDEFKQLQSIQHEEQQSNSQRDQDLSIDRDSKEV